MTVWYKSTKNAPAFKFCCLTFFETLRNLCQSWLIYVKSKTKAKATATEIIIIIVSLLNSF
jgi:hypothetical protein